MTYGKKNAGFDVVTYIFERKICNSFETVVSSEK